MLVVAQNVEEDVLNQLWYTQHTGSTNADKWVRIATCTNTYAFQDFGTVFELFGNGSSCSTYFYGRLTARFKRQSPNPGPATSMSLILHDSNIGTENIKGVRNGATIDIYLKINMYHTRYYFRRLIRANSRITALQEEPFLNNLPSGDLIINCVDAKVFASSLDVKGTIKAKEIKVVAQTADFVFEDDYQLKDLSEVEQFITTNKHLPDIPSAKQMKENGIGLAEMNKLLLQKIEEMTLHIIELNKRVYKLESDKNEK
ncbi:hypothetical protein DF185_22610 [Marinifilum breve]|uniref:Uncharacterized protein n=2 Tax=Marinifilum breve TaxID=2184082 RepID=A0A2V3ZTM9_9BACT|nr:hypothetical protein DF185_22610 [Marinifilum breve]